VRDVKKEYEMMVLQHDETTGFRSGEVTGYGAVMTNDDNLDNGQISTAIQQYPHSPWYSQLPNIVHVSQSTCSPETS